MEGRKEGRKKKVSEGKKHSDDPPKRGGTSVESLGTARRC
tara:strand:+ start:351 stop:470 length:120 start_codon:yes stop_codon:yes gene_type:complete